jgi:hypothetical protein
VKIAVTGPVSTTTFTVPSSPLVAGLAYRVDQKAGPHDMHGLAF